MSCIPVASAASIHRSAARSGFYRVVLAEDFTSVRQTVRQLIEEDAAFEIVGEAADGDAAAAWARELQPDLLVTDLMMPGLNGLEVMQQLRETSPQTRVVVVSIHQDEPYVREAFHCGAMAYVHKEALDSHLLAALRSVVSGDRYASPPLALPDNDEDREANHGDLDAWETLTGREMRILRLAISDQPVVALARDLATSQGTAAALLQELLRKLGVQTREELRQEARARNMILDDAI